MVTRTRKQRRNGEKAPKDERLLVRLETAEKEAFEAAAKLKGMPLSVWVRLKLRRAATNELEAEGLPIPFLKDIKLD